MNDAEKNSWQTTCDAALKELEKFNELGRFGFTAWYNHFTEEWIEVEVTLLREKKLDFEKKWGMHLNFEVSIITDS